MRDFDEYLNQLRAALDVTPKRADEICREVRSHLETRVRELMATGLDENEAAQEAVREFGEPKHVAAQLTQANDTHRRANRVRALLGFMVVFTAMFTVAIFWQVPSSVRNGVRISRDLRAIHLLAAYTPLSLMQAKSLFQFLVVLPAAVLAGMLAGRRRWWVAGAPPLLLLILLISVVVLLGRGPHPAMSLRDLGYPARWTLISALVMAGCGYLGSRALKRRSTALVVGLVCGAYVALTGLAISGMMVAVISHAGTRRIAGNIWWIVILVAELSVLLLGALAHRAYRNRQVSA